MKIRNLVARKEIDEKKKKTKNKNKTKTKKRQNETKAMAKWQNGDNKKTKNNTKKC